MRLAVENTIQIGRQCIVLRPSLRAAIRLERQHGLQAIISGIRDGSLSVMADVIRESTDAFDPDLLLEIGPAGLGTTMEALTGPLLSHVLDTYGIDLDAKPPKPTPAKRGKPIDPFAELFSIATGVLGWSADDAYAASPAEIIAARDGRNRFTSEILRAVFGGKDEPDEPDQPADPLDAELDRAGLAELRAMAR